MLSETEGTPAYIGRAPFSTGTESVSSCCVKKRMSVCSASRYKNAINYVINENATSNVNVEKTDCAS